MKSSSSKGQLALYLGADWWGSDARALAVALRNLGISLIEVQYEDYLPPTWSSFSLKVLRRLIRPWCVSNYNHTIEQYAGNLAIDFVLVFKGMLLEPKTIAAFRLRNIPIYCFYPDVGFASFGSNLRECLSCYDCFFTTKEFHLHDRELLEKVRKMVLVPHGFDPDVHRKVPVSEKMLAYYGCDLSFVGCWSPKKELAISTLLRRLPKRVVKVWGPGWNRAASDVQHCWAGRGAYGDELAVIYLCSTINLGLLSESVSDSSSGDCTTVRTWQIPACGAFLLHEFTLELEKFYLVDREVGIFRSNDDLAEKAKNYLENDILRQTIARAGFDRVRAANITYDEAAKVICEYHSNSNFTSV